MVGCRDGALQCDVTRCDVICGRKLGSGRVAVLSSFLLFASPDC